MKTRILLLASAVLTLTFASAVYAVGNGASVEKVSGQSAAQVQANNPDVGEQIQVQVQTQQKLQDGSEDGEPVQNKTQEKVQAGQDDDEDSKGNQEQNRSQVANAVQEMLQVAERNEGIGEQVRIIAQNQNSNQEKIGESLEKIQSRNGFSKFLIGPNYGEIRNAEKLLEENSEQIEELLNLKDELTNASDIEILEEQIQVLENVDLEVEEMLDELQEGISLFGWVFKLFAD